MNDEKSRTLFYPFDAGAIEPPGKGQRVLFLGAEPGFRLPVGFAADLYCVQGFRSSFLKLRAERRAVAAEVEGDGYDTALALCGRYRGQNEGWIGQAIERVAPGGLVVVAGAKDDGIGSLRKRLGEFIQIEGSESKFHGMALWLRRPADPAIAITALLAGNGEVPIENRYRTAPGMFSHGEIDKASRLLVDHLPTDLSGKVADFCAGWGYLACAVAERCPRVKAIDLYEADHASLEAAKHNMATNAPALPARFFWHDLVGEAVGEHYDAIVMNPPFHQGRAAKPGIGQTLIAVAAKALHRSGRLFVVANRQLPYETALASSFSRVEKLAEANGFKMFCATR